MSGRVQKIELFNDITNSTHQNNVRKLNKRNNKSKDRVKNNNEHKGNVKYLSKQVVNKMAQEIRLKKEISREVARIKKEISKTDSETVRYQTRYVPDIKYEISKRQVMCKKLQNQQDSFEKNLEVIDGQIVTVEAYKQTVEEELASKYVSIEANKTKECEETTADIKDKYEDELRELENLTPKDELEVEINTLRERMLDYLEQCDDLKIFNEKQLKNKEIEIKEQFEEFKTTKQNEMETVLAKGREILENKSNQIDEKNKLNDQILELDANLKDIQSTLTTLQNELDTINKDYADIQDKSESIDSVIIQATKDLDKIQEEARLHDTKYNEYYNTMETELTRRKKLENSIDEVKGLIRCFLYTEDSNLPGFTVDYFDNVALFETPQNENEDSSKNEEINDDDIYPFSRIIPSNALSVPQLIFREYKPYHDMCINNNQNFTLFSVSHKPWLEFQTQFVEFLLHEYSQQFNINFQNVYLSDGKLSKDLLASKENDINTPATSACISIKFDSENNLMLDSTTITLTEYISNRKNGQNISDYDSTSGINLFKFQFIKKASSSNEPSTNEVINFYLIQFESLRFLTKLSSYLSDVKPTEPNHVGYVINKLMNNLKSCFLFNLSASIEENEDNSTDIVQKTLKIGTDIGRIPNLQRRK
ncbi:spindle pole body-associated protein Vik1p [Monosporozyma servazzii]